MLTFDTAAVAREPATLADFLKSRLPDLVEVGENDTCWVMVSRKRRTLEFVSKQTGVTVTRCSLDTAADCGISPRQLDAARRVLEL